MSLIQFQDVDGSLQDLLTKDAPVKDSFKSYEDKIDANVSDWLNFAAELENTQGQPRGMKPLMEKLNLHLAVRTFLVDKLTVADVAVWAALIKCGKKSPGAVAIIKQFAFVQRWSNYLVKTKTIRSIYQHFLDSQQNSAPAAKAPAAKKEGLNLGHTGGYLKLENVDKVGQVVTRFPPEPSGYLHIGHAKAALLNYHYAQQYNGKLLIRFDDTNPRKEKEEYIHNILKDLDTLGIPGGNIATYTSDYFEQIEKFAEQLIKQGDGYVDNTPLQEIRDKRMTGDVTPARSNSVEENLRLFEEMKKASPEGVECILRAKIESEHGPMKTPNKALRDPALYRVVTDADHPRLGDKYKAYPLYDFACPIVDSLEGVTHALRTNEYHDRNPLYYWVIEKLGLRKVFIEDYSRLNFAYSVMSKRKLQQFVNMGKVDGWNHPSFPTIQGFVRRGLSMDALRAFVISQGGSKSVNLMDINKLWAVNKKVIDPIVPRYSAIDANRKCLVKITNFGDHVAQKSIPKHKQNPSLGEKVITFSDEIYIEGVDANDVTEGEEVTLMDWGNAIFKSIKRDADNNVTHIEADLNLAGDFKTTKKKLNWLDSKAKLTNIVVREYDTLINVPKIPADGNFEDFVNEQIEYETKVVGDASLRDFQKGASLQFERRGYFICDEAFQSDDKPIVFIMIPDGKTKSMSVVSSKVANKNSRAQ